MEEQPHSGTLYVVATPIGNLTDMSARCIAVLKEAHVIAAEDTRRTARLTSEIGAGARLESFHAHSDRGKIDRIVQLLLQGKTVALVSDAGTPGISDPGADLVRAARTAGVPVVPIPGPSAVAAALSASGFSADRYTFLGFLPRRGKQRRELLSAVAGSTWTTVFFESPNRVADTLDELASLLAPGRTAVVGREITKRFEEFKTGTPAELAVYYREEPVRGEVTVVIEGGSGPERVLDPEVVATRARELLEQGNTRKDAVSLLVTEFGASRNEVYRIVTKL